jgi:hypothetical protein
VVQLIQVKLTGAAGSAGVPGEQGSGERQRMPDDGTATQQEGEASGTASPGDGWARVVKKRAPPKPAVGSDEMTKSMLQARVLKVDSLLAMQKGLNEVLQQKLLVLVRKCDERDQRIYTMATAMRKVERDTDQRAAALEKERSEMKSGQKYRELQDQLRNRATMIIEGEGKNSQLEAKNAALLKRCRGLEGQIALAQVRMHCVWEC